MMRKKNAVSSYSITCELVGLDNIDAQTVLKRTEFP